MYKSGLVLEGGGNRAIYTSGVLDAFMENDIDFPYVIGVSAGSCNAASFIAKSIRRQHDIIINYSNDERYMGFKNLFKNGEFLNEEWIFDELSYDLMPIDQKKFDESETVLCAVSTNALTGKAEYFYPKDMHERGCPILRASCALPIATKGVDINGLLYFDGGIVDSIPLKRAIEDGCQKPVVILTQDRDYVKKPLKIRKPIEKALAEYPLLTKALLNRHNMYNEQLKLVAEEEAKGNIFVIRPAKPLGCKTLERDLTKLELIYQLGYQQGKRNAEKVREFLAD